MWGREGAWRVVGEGAWRGVNWEGACCGVGRVRGVGLGGCVV